MTDPTSDTTTEASSREICREVLSHPGVIRVLQTLTRLGAPEAAGRVVVLDDHARTATAAAEQLGVQVGQIANSLIFAVPQDNPDGAGPRPLLILTSGAHRVDVAKVAAHLGVPRLDRAPADFVRDRTGFVIGGVAPVGHLEPVQTLVDLALADHHEVWAAAGHARTVFPTTFAELVRITGGAAVDVA